MRVLVHAPGADYQNEAAFRIRLLDLRSALAARGCELVIKPRLKSPLARYRLARMARDFDAVILHRKWLDPWEARLLRRSLPAGRKIVMDLDDATMLHETPLGFIARRRLERRFLATRRVLDVLVAGNAHLADAVATYICRPNPRPNGDACPKTIIIPSVVDPARYSPKIHGPTTHPALVWIGSSSTLKYLEEALPMLTRAADLVPGLSLQVICDRPPCAPASALPIHFHPWSLESEAKLLQQADIGIAPTPDTPWTQGKCGFKIVQYMAAGLPVVASPVGANVAILATANGEPAGLLPGSLNEWPSAIQRLAGDPTLRGQMGLIAYKRAQQSYSIEAAVSLWMRALSD